MLGQTFRLSHRLDIARVYKRGKQVRSSRLNLRYLPNYQTDLRVTVVVSTKVTKSAVKRNQLRRRLRAVLRQLLPRLKGGYDIVVMANKQTLNLSAASLRRQLETCLDQANLLKSSPQQ